MRDRGDRLFALYGALLFAAYALLILLHPTPPPLGDFADWVYQGQLLARHLHGLPDPMHHLKPYPVPNSTATVLLGLLSACMPWQVAAKIFLCLALVLAWFGIRALSHTSGTPRWIWLVAPSAFFLNINFWYGLISFHLAVSLLFLFLAVVLRSDATGHSRALQTLLLVLLFFTHMVPFTFACLVLICRCSLRRDLRSLAPVWPSAALLLWYIAGRFRGGNPDTETAMNPGAGSVGFFAMYKVNTLLKSFGFVNPGDLYEHSTALALLGRPFYLLLFTANLVVCATVLVLLWPKLTAWAAALRRPQGQSTREAAIGAAILLCLPVYLLLPRAMLGISDPGARVLQVALYTGIFFCTRGTGTWRISAGSSVLLAASGLVLFARTAFVEPVTGDRPAVPEIAERLALVPYTGSQGAYDLLKRGDYTLVVFPTGLFVTKR